DARIRNAQETITGLERDVDDYRKRLELVSAQEKMNLTLAESGYVSKLAALSATDARVEIGRLLSSAESNLAATRETATSLKAQRAAFLQKWRSDNGTELV